MPSFHLLVDDRSNSLDALSHFGKVKNYPHVVRKELFKKHKLEKSWEYGVPDDILRGTGIELLRTTKPGLFQGNRDSWDP
jgi:hypothetical protein